MRIANLTVSILVNVVRQGVRLIVRNVDVRSLASSLGAATASSLCYVGERLWQRLLSAVGGKQGMFATPTVDGVGRYQLAAQRPGPCCPGRCDALHRPAAG